MKSRFGSPAPENPRAAAPPAPDRRNAACVPRATRPATTAGSFAVRAFPRKADKARPAGAGSTGTKFRPAACGTATTRLASRRKRWIACSRTASDGVITIVARPSRSSIGVRLRTRSASVCQPESIQGDRSCSVMTLGRSGKYGTAKSVPWKRSTPVREISPCNPHSHQRRSSKLRGPRPIFKLARAPSGGVNRLIGKQPEFVLGKILRQRAAQLFRVAPHAPARHGQGLASNAIFPSLPEHHLQSRNFWKTALVSRY